MPLPSTEDFRIIEGLSDAEIAELTTAAERKMQARIAAAFGVTLYERSVGKQLAALGFRRLSVRPQHPKSDPQAQEAFKKTSPRR
jgi:transposase